MTKLLLIRHGYSVTNKERKFTGQLDIPLDAKGELQAQQVSDYVFRNYKVDKIYSSDSQRAVNTVKPLADLLGMTVETNKNLRELDLGEWQGKYIDDVKKEYAQSYSAYTKDPWNERCDGGENFEELYNRANREILKIAKENDGKTVAVATHGGVIKVLQCVWSGIDTALLPELSPVPNASLTVVTCNDGKFTIEIPAYDDYLKEQTRENNPQIN